MFAAGSWLISHKLMESGIKSVPYVGKKFVTQNQVMQLPKVMSKKEYEEALARSQTIMEIVSSLDWSTVKEIHLAWSDDAEANYVIGSTEPCDIRPPTSEIMTIQIISEPGTLPIPRDEKGRPEGEGAIL